MCDQGITVRGLRTQYLKRYEADVPKDHVSIGRKDHQLLDDKGPANKQYLAHRQARSFLIILQSCAVMERHCCAWIKQLEAKRSDQPLDLCKKAQSLNDVETHPLQGQIQLTTKSAR